MSRDFIQLISVVASPILPNLFAYLLFFILVVRVKYHFPKE